MSDNFDIVKQLNRNCSEFTTKQIGINGFFLMAKLIHSIMVDNVELHIVTIK